MQFFKTAIFFSLVAVGLAAAAPEGDSEMLQKRGFGCPDDGPCNTHVSTPFTAFVGDYTDRMDQQCKDIGRNGGYCAGFLQR